MLELGGVITILSCIFFMIMIGVGRTNDKRSREGWYCSSIMLRIKKKNILNFVYWVHTWVFLFMFIVEKKY